MKFNLLLCFKLCILMSGVQYPSLLCNYYVVFIDDFTKFTRFFLLKKKNELVVVFKHFKNLVENQYSSKIKVLRPDNGKEYVNSQFQNFCSDHGILHQTSCPHTP